MRQHLDTMKDILESGDVKTDRTKTGTISKFGGSMKFSLQHGWWPIPTTREVDHLKISSELEWMLKGLVSVQWLKDNNNGIWNDWMGEQSGTIGPMYGEQWRNWNAYASPKDIEDAFTEAQTEADYRGDRDLMATAVIQKVRAKIADKTKLYEHGGRGGVDQLQYVVDELKHNPDSRRICVSVWHANLLPEAGYSPSQNADRGKMALAPCHSMWQVNTALLSDLEILRETLYEEEEFWPTIQQASMMHASVDTVEIAKYIKMMANVLLEKKKLIETSAAQANFQMDSDLQLTDGGRAVVQAYKEMGKPTRKLSLLCFARSQDVPLGTVFNVSMYSLLAHILAQQTNMIPWEYTHFMGDYHIYSNQVEKVKIQLERSPMKPPRIIIDPTLSAVEAFDHKNLQVFYISHPKIIYPRAAV